MKSTLSELPGHRISLDRQASVRELEHLLRERADLPGVIVTGDGLPLGMISRRMLLEYLGRPEVSGAARAQSLAALQTVLDADPLRLLATDRIEVAAQLALYRPHETLYDPILVDHADGSASLLEIQVVLFALYQIFQVISQENETLATNVQTYAHRLETALDELTTTHEQLLSDMRGRERAEQALRDSEHRFRGLIEGSLQGLLICRDRHPLFCNQAFAALYGYAGPTEVLETDTIPAGLLPQPGVERPDAGRLGVSATEPGPSDPAADAGTAQPRRILQTRLDGRPIWVDVVSRTIDWFGAPALQITVVDVTPQVLSRRAETLLSEGIDGLQDAFLLTDADGCVVFTNRRFHTLFPALPGPNEIRGRPLAALDRAAAGTALHLSDDGLPQRPGSDVPAHRTEEVQDAYGRWFLVKEQRTAAGGLLSIRTDITALKQAQAEVAAQSAMLRAAIEAMPDGILLYDEALRIELFNDAFVRMWDYPRAAVRTGGSLVDLLELNWERGDYGQQDRRKAIAEAIERLRADNPTSYERRLNTGRVLQVRSWPRPEGGFVATYADITDQKAAEQALRSAKEQAETVAEQKSMFLAAMSHEVRTPINSMLGLLELMADSGLDPEQRDMVAIMQESATTLLRVLNDVLDVAKIEAGRLDLEQAPLSLPDLVESVAASFGAEAFAQRNTLITQIDPAAERPLLGDATRLRQVLANLGSNAVKFTEAGKVVFRLQVLGQTDRKVQVRFEVADTGIGMSQDQQAGLFQPFSQAARDTARRFGGTGLGLSICRQLLHLMGGTIGVSSAVGKGSTFWCEVTLDRPTETAESGGDTAARPSPESRTATAACGPTVREPPEQSRTWTSIETGRGGRGGFTRPEGPPFEARALAVPDGVVRIAVHDADLAAGLRLTLVAVGLACELWPDAAVALARHRADRSGGRPCLLIVDGGRDVPEPCAAAGGALPLDAACIVIRCCGTRSQPQRSYSFGPLILTLPVRRAVLRRAAAEALGLGVAQDGAAAEPVPPLPAAATAAAATTTVAGSTPRADAEAVPVGLAQAAPARPLGAGGAGARRAGAAPILVVDDHPTNREVLRRQLAALGFACDLAADGAAGLEAVRSHPYRLIFTDSRMPGVDGPEMAARIRQLRPDRSAETPYLPVIAITGSTLPEEIDRCYAAGIDDHLSKPVTLGTLAACLRRWLPDAGEAARQPTLPFDDVRQPTEPPADPQDSVPLDITSLEHLFAGDAAAVDALLDDFRTVCASARTAIEAALRTRSADRLIEEGHRLKGAAGNLGATALERTAAALEKAAKQADWSQLPRLAADVTAAVARIDACLVERASADDS